MYQQVTIVGYLGSDPELRYTPSDQAVCNMSVATNRKWTDGQGNQQEETVWFRVAAWGRMGEACGQYLAKGRQVMVVGRLLPDAESGGPRIWQDQSGNPRASFELTAQEVKFLGGGGGQPRQHNDAQSEWYQQEEEIPF